MSTPTPATQPEHDADAIGMELARSNAEVFVFIGRHLSAEQRIDFVRAFIATLAGMAEQSIGHDASREVLRFVSTLPPAGNVGPLQ